MFEYNKTMISEKRRKKDKSKEINVDSALLLLVQTKIA